jgi:wyosine [tRNA(Phe)-imidazoG37] synthetase (radical SAM superfamily)
LLSKPLPIPAALEAQVGSLSQVQIPDNSIAGHVPDDLVYGPVRSRRFGASLGISFSHEGQVSCRWRCPYCQLGAAGHLPGQSHAPAADILTAVDRWLAAWDGTGLDVVTVAGAGEPMDHPDCAALAKALRQRVADRGVELILLTNGDGIDEPERQAAVACFDRVYIKWDPGAPAGCWRPMAPGEREARLHALSHMPDLRIQAMLFRRGAAGGNGDPGRRQRFVEDMQRLAPIEVHLGITDRPTPGGRVGPVDRALLDEWGRDLQPALPDGGLLLI